MKRIFISMVVTCSLAVALWGVGGCGGASSDPNLPNSNSPIISSVKGDGASDENFVDSLMITGENFVDGMTVKLQGTDNGNNFELGYTLNSETSIAADLPSALTEGSYDLVITSDAGEDTAAVTILSGVVGPAGPAGADGADGITIEAEFMCNDSTVELDSNPTEEHRRGLKTWVVRFTDGSYYMSCRDEYSSTVYTFRDTSSDSRWFAPDSVGVIDGEIGCVPSYVTALYSIANNTVTYAGDGSPILTQTIPCLQMYP